MAIFFPRVFLYSVFYFFVHLWWFGGFGVGVLDWVFCLGGFGFWGLGPVVRVLLGFLGWDSLYKHKRVTQGKRWCVYMLYNLCLVMNDE